MKYILSHDTYVLKFLENNSYSLINQIVNKITQKLDYTTQLLSTQKVTAVPTFKVDVESVLLSHGYTFAVASITDWPDWQLYQWCSDQRGAIPQLVVLSNGWHYRSGSGRLALAKCPRLCKFIHYSFRTFSTLSTLIKTLFFSGNILLINTAWQSCMTKPIITCCSVLPPAIVMHDAHIGGRSENNIKCGVHDDLGWKNRTTRYNCRFSAALLDLWVIFSVS